MEISDGFRQFRIQRSQNLIFRNTKSDLLRYDWNR